ncbi:alpha/beta fold hydrolase [Tsukamurella sp. 1534]|uniref:alpha/beta fold hydrolase n=1 Tax=Tsukamurella sp. 1534 TaxID=1151061 RepID=UPI000319D331|nr:alpha/beta fold hydrolase [Tsukamurella sp. 1534]
MITVNGRWARVRTAGDESLPTVLLLHGITRSLEDWDPQFDSLAGQYHLVATDLPGYGWSAPHPDGAGLDALARGVGETLDALNITGPVHVVGNSLGGAVTMTLLAQRPDQVAAITLVDPAGFGKEVTPLLRVLGIPVLGRILATTASRPSAILQERLIFADKSFATRARIDHALAIARETEAGLTAWRTADLLGSIRHGIEQAWRDELHARIAKTPRPTLVLWGDRDRVLPPSHLSAARMLMPHAEGHLIPGVGHMPQLECAERFNELLTDFLDRNAATDLPRAASQ